MNDHHLDPHWTTLLDALSELIWVSGTDPARVFFNRSWLEFRGRTLEQDVGDRWIEGVHPDDREAYLADYERAFETREPFAIEYRLRRGDGEDRWIRDEARPWTDSDGRFAGYVGSCVDMSGRRSVEEDVHQLSMAVENAMTGVSKLDCDGTFVMVRRGYAAVLGYDDPSELVGRSWTVTVPEERHAYGAEAYERMLSDGRVEFTTKGLRRDGTVIDKRLLLVASFDRAGVRDGHYCFMRDVTEELAAEQRRRLLEEELRQSQKMEAIGTLASGVAHDFNNLLTAIGGFLELSDRTVEPGHPARAYHERIATAVDQAAGLCNSLLRFGSREDAAREPVDIGALIKGSFSLLRRLLPARVDLIVDEVGEGEVWTEADSVQLQQILVNLVVNARDAIADTGRIELRLDADAHEVRIAVTDDGSGMDDEVQGHLFEPFYTTKDRGHGTGLGLAIVHGIVRDHGGRIELESKLGAGSTFTVFLPRTSPAPVTGQVDEPLAHASHKGAHILVAEDNPVVREFIELSLAQAGYRVTTAVDGQNAIEAFRRVGANLDLVVLDLDLPKRSGQSCRSEIRDAQPQLPALLISGNLHQHSGDLEGDAGLAKPFSVDELLDSIAELLPAEVAHRAR